MGKISNATNAKKAGAQFHTKSPAHLVTISAQAV